jgi:hypothetical protein
MGAIIGLANILQEISTGQILLLRPSGGISYGGGRLIDARTLVASLSQAAGIKTRPTTEV